MMYKDNETVPEIMQDLTAVINKHKSKISPIEMIAVFAKMAGEVGRSCGFDQRDVMQTIIANGVFGYETSNVTFVKPN